MGAPATEAAIDSISKLIIGGTLPSGSRLPSEPELAAQLHASRNTVREAVRALVTARVLDVRRGDGTYVTSLEPHLLLEGIGFAVELMQDERALELLELRKILEPAATGLAAQRISSDVLLDLGACLGAMRYSKGELRIKQDIDFHGKIAAASGNQTLATLLAGISGKTVHARIWHGTLDAEADTRAHEDHETIYAAVQAGDAQLAESAARVHVAHTEQWYRRMLEGVGPAAKLS
jgi:GntR family transcriptional regulator, transcriptional repressor for pyruvate dehydrogenase complex